MDGRMEAMDRTSIQVTEELADELWNRKNRGESYEDVIWRLIERADNGGGDDGNSRAEAAGTAEAAHAAPDSQDDEPSDAVAAVVARVSEGWSDTDERLAARREAAHVALQQAVETGEAMGKSEALNQFYGEYAVDGQNEETWWRKNIRPVLKEVGVYSNAEHGYVVTEL